MSSICYRVDIVAHLMDSIECMGGGERTFACISRECLWQDWYIYVLVLYHRNAVMHNKQFSINKI